MRSHALVSQVNPPLQFVDHDSFEDPITCTLVNPRIGDVCCIGNPWIHTVETNRVEDLIEARCIRGSALLTEELGAVATVGFLLDRHDCLTRQIATHNQRLNVVEPTGTEELTPTALGAVQVGSVIERNCFCRRLLLRLAG